MLTVKVLPVCLPFTVMVAVRWLLLPFFVTVTLTVAVPVPLTFDNVHHDVALDSAIHSSLPVMVKLFELAALSNERDVVDTEKE